MIRLARRVFRLEKDGTKELESEMVDDRQRSYQDHGITVVFASGVECAPELSPGQAVATDFYFTKRMGISGTAALVVQRAAISASDRGVVYDHAGVRIGSVVRAWRAGEVFDYVLDGGGLHHGFTIGVAEAEA